MKKLKNIFFMLLIAMTAVCSSVYAEPEAATQTEAQTQQAAEPTEKPAPSATVAPELADNQVEVKTGATEVIFTISHKDTIDISVLSPSNAVLTTSNDRVVTKSVEGGTEVRIKDPEPGIWTMNASSMTGDAVKVKGSCAYNFMIELQSEKGAVIYSGISNKFIAFIKSKDGSKIDPDVLRTATMKLNIKEGDSDKPKEIDMTFKGAAFETTYTHNKVERISIYATAIINDAEIQSDALDIISIVDPNEGGGFPIWVIILIVVALTGAGVLVYIKFADKIKSGTAKGGKNMSGSLTINITVNGDEKLPVTRNLAMLGESAGMLTIIGDDEYYDVDGITVSGIEKGIKIVNKSRCEVLFSNVGADPNGVKLLDNQYFKIFMPDEKTVITVTYHSDDIFAGLINAASEQQKKMEEKIAASQQDAVTAEELYKEFDNPEEVFDNPEEANADEEKPSDSSENENNDTAADTAEAEVSEIAAPALESLNLSEVSEDAVPEETKEEAVEISDEAVEEMPSFTVDAPDAEEPAEQPVEEEDYTPDTAPALESFSFSGLTEDAVPEETEETAESAQEVSDEAVEEMPSFTVDAPDAEEPAEQPVEEEYTFDTAPALESIDFSFNDIDSTDSDDNTATAEETDTQAAEDISDAESDDTVVIDNGSDDTVVIDSNADDTDDTVIIDNEPEQASSSLFGDLASLANEVASETDKSDYAQDSDTGISFGDLASLAEQAASSEGSDDDSSKTVIMDESDDEDLFDLQHLADELTKND